MSLLRDVHASPRLQCFWPKQVVHGIHDSLRPKKTPIMLALMTVRSKVKPFALELVLDTKTNMHALTP